MLRLLPLLLRAALALTRLALHWQHCSILTTDMCVRAVCYVFVHSLAALQQVSEVFHRAGRPLDEPVFAAGIGNRETDAIAYQVRHLSH
jgi:hypothetical protein